MSALASIAPNCGRRLEATWSRMSPETCWGGLRLLPAQEDLLNCGVDVAGPVVDERVLGEGALLHRLLDHCLPSLLPTPDARVVRGDEDLRAQEAHETYEARVALPVLGLKEVPEDLLGEGQEAAQLLGPPPQGRHGRNVLHGGASTAAALHRCLRSAEAATAPAAAGPAVVAAKQATRLCRPRGSAALKLPPNEGIARPARQGTE